MQASNFGGTFDQLFLEFFMKFSLKMPLDFFNSMVQKMTKMSNQGGPALKRDRTFTLTQIKRFSFLRTVDFRAKKIGLHDHLAELTN